MKLIFCSILLVLVSASIKADTLTVMTNESVNGRVTYQLGEFIVEAKFKNNEPRKLVIVRKDVRSVEINTRLVNQGAPPDWITKYQIGVTSKKDNKNINIEINPNPSRPEVEKPYNPSDIQGLTRKSKAPDDIPLPPSAPIGESINVTQPKENLDVIRLNNGTKRTGRLISITSDLIQISDAKQQVPFGRGVVNSIIVGH